MSKNACKKSGKKKVIRFARIPYGTKELEKFKTMLKEAVDSQIRMDLEKEHKKAVLEAILDEFPIQKKFLGQLVKIEYKNAQMEAYEHANSLSEAMAFLHPEVLPDTGESSES